jgi:hypothetical protein
MRILILLVAVTGLATGGCRVSTDSENFESQVKEWVPLGMKASKAQKVMEKKGFDCNIIKHDSVFNTNDVDWLDCTREQVWFHDWEARIILKDDKVIGYGPAKVK